MGYQEVAIKIRPNENANEKIQELQVEIEELKQNNIDIFEDNKKLEEENKALQAKLQEYTNGTLINILCNAEEKIKELEEQLKSTYKKHREQLQAQRKQIVKEIEQRACLTHPYDSKTNKSIDIYLVTPEILDNLLKIV